MTKDEALKLALEALELFAVWESEGDEQTPATDAITAIKEALVQPEQPIDPMRKRVEDFARKCGWEPSDGEGAFECVQRASYEQGLKDGHEKGNPRLQKIGPLYTAATKREWVGLTDDEIKQALGISKYALSSIVDARAIEAKLKEKNT